jgi:hypothetical protein
MSQLLSTSLSSFLCATGSVRCLGSRWRRGYQGVTPAKRTTPDKLRQTKAIYCGFNFFCCDTCVLGEFLLLVFGLKVSSHYADSLPTPMRDCFYPCHCQGGVFYHDIQLVLSINLSTTIVQASELYEIDRANQPVSTAPTSQYCRAKRARIDRAYEPLSTEPTEPESTVPTSQYRPSRRARIDKPQSNN